VETSVIETLLLIGQSASRQQGLNAQRERRNVPSFIRTLTVGSGISPDLLTLDESKSIEPLAGSRCFRTAYRRWGIPPRPEDKATIGRA
jgi:hypothetical protein